MNQAEQDLRMDYIEFPTKNIKETKRFYSKVFGWAFTDYGDSYTSFSDGRLGGGFELASDVTAGCPLVVLYATNLEEIEAKITECGGHIIKQTFEKGLLLLGCGENSIRFSPSLTVNSKEIDVCLSIFEEAMKEVAG